MDGGVNMQQQQTRPRRKSRTRTMLEWGAPVSVEPSLYKNQTVLQTFVFSAGYELRQVPYGFGRPTTKEVASSSCS